jgi:hypothetical protein
MENFVKNLTENGGIAIVSQSIRSMTGEVDAVLVSSQITFRCVSGTAADEANLKVICNEDGQWSTLPVCVGQVVRTGMFVTNIGCFH